MSEGRIKRALDGLATVAIIVTCAVAVWTMLDGRLRPAIGPVQAAPRQRPADPPPPTDPVSINGAALRGDGGAKAALIVYSDFQCPYCGTFAREVLPALQTKYVDTGKVLLAFRQFPLNSIHPYAEKAAEASLCAARQGKFWQMHDQLFKDQSLLKQPGVFEQAGGSIGLDPNQYGSCLQGQVTASVVRDADGGKALQVTGTPTFFIGRLQSDQRVKVVRRLSGARPVADFEVALQAVLQ